MTTLLHVLTRPADDWIQSLILSQESSGNHTVEVIDLTLGTPDYAHLVERVFAADSVATW